MALHIHYGSSGSGKSYNLYRRILAEADRDKDKSFIVIVPEQFTLQTQKEFVRLSPNGGILNIDVLSFQRLAYRVFEEFGGNRQLALEDTGKSMIVKKVLMDKKAALSLYGGNIGRPGFVDEIKSIIAEFYQYNIGDRELDRMEALAEGRPLMRNKIRDIRIIYDGFRDFLRGKYITNEEILDKLCEAAGNSRLLKGCVMCMDGFTGFTPVQYKLIDVLLRYVQELHVTVSMDARDVGRKLREHDLFYLSYKTAWKLGKLAAENDVTLVCTAEQGRPFRFNASPALGHLEHNIFRYPAEPYGKPQEDVVFMSSGSRREEVTLTACEIKRLVRGGLKYGDIAVISGDVAGYGRLAAELFERADIPYFVDEKQNILKNPLVEMVRSLVEIAQTDFSYASVFRFLRCGISVLGGDETDVLENYVIALGIRGRSRWGQEWSYTYKTFCEVNLDEINTWRQKVYRVLSPAAASLCDSGVCVREKLAAVCRLLLEADAAGQLARLLPPGQKLSISRLEKERENDQVWRLVMEVFGRVEALLGDEALPLDEFANILDTGFREARLRVVPPSADSIVIGDIERTRLKAVKVLFFLGMNDGIVPKSGSGGGILSDADRELLSEHDIELAPTGRQNACMTEFYMYLSLTKPSQKLYVSWYNIGADGRPARPSYLVDRLRRLFTVREEGAGGENPREASYIKTVSLSALASESRGGLIDALLGTDRGFTAMTRAMRDGAGEHSDIISALYFLFMREEPQRIKNIMKALRGEGAREKLDEAHARELYGSVLTGSVTRLEQYAACAFAHFLRYGLRLEERAVYEFKAPDLGIMYHKSIELFGRELRDSGQSWHTIDSETKLRCVETAVGEAVTGYGNGVLKSSGRNEYIITRLARVVRRTVDVLEAQIKAGSFEPRYYEEAFLHAGKYMNLRGKIDRMDVAESAGKLYLRVVDYKSGSASFDLQRLYYGLSLQLGVYLAEGMQLIENSSAAAEVVPAGIFYYNIDDPIVEKTEHAEEDIMRELRLKGLANSDSRVLALLDTSFDDEAGGVRPCVKSSVMNVETLKSGEFSKSSMLAETAGMRALCGFLDGRLHAYGEAIMEGDAAARPYRLDGHTACDYCGYRAVCGFERGAGGSQYNELETKSDDELWREICRETDGQTNSEE